MTRSVCRARPGSRLRAGAAAAVLGLLAAGAMADLQAQETPPAATDSADAASGRGPVTPAEADAIRDSLNLQRPPADYGADWVDVVEFPLKLIGWPLNYALVKGPALLVSALTAPRPPSSLARAYQSVSEWGLKPTIRTTIGPRSAAAVELQLDRFRPFYAHAAVSRRLSQRYRTGVLLSGDRTWLASEAKWQSDAQTPFYGVGSDTQAEDRAFYRRNWWDVTARTGYRLAPALIVAVGVGWEHNEVEDPVGSSNSIFGAFDTDTLYGAGEVTDYIRTELNATLDLTRWREFQQHGSTMGLAVRTFHGLGDTESDFRLVTGFIQTYVPINRRQLVALRVISDISRDDGGEGVPFYHLSGLGGSRSALGYPSRRFVDEDMLAFMSEYRFEVWRELQGRMRAETFLFFHYGAVGERVGRIEDGDWHPSYGVGLRLTRPTSLVGLGYLGFGGEGMTAGIRGSWPF